MMYYAYIINNELTNGGQAPLEAEGLINVDIPEEVYNYLDHYIWDKKTKKVVLNPNYEQEQAEKQRQLLDSMTLTPADVERALYRAKGIDFDDLKALIVQQMPTIDIKALSIEFRAKDFFRGAEANGMRLFDVVGALLGYTPDDMDYLFQHKELPEKEVNNE